MSFFPPFVVGFICGVGVTAFVFLSHFFKDKE